MIDDIHNKLFHPLKAGAPSEELVTVCALIEFGIFIADAWVDPVPDVFWLLQCKAKGFLVFRRREEIIQLGEAADDMVFIPDIS